MSSTTTSRPGLVVGSEPTAGEVIRKFQPVSLAVSKGPELFPLPELTGKTLDEAKTTLNGAEMALGPITETFDEKAPAGTVLAQAPRSGNPVRHGTPVGLTVSKGPQPIPVPDVRGQEQDAAVKALEAAGLKAVVAPEPVNDKKVPEGAVVAQDPASGNLTKGGTVTLTISKGPKLVEVPSFIGKQADGGPGSPGEARLRGPGQQHPGRILRHGPRPGSGGHEASRKARSSPSPWSDRHPAQRPTPLAQESSARLVQPGGAFLSAFVASVGTFAELRSRRQRLESAPATRNAISSDCMWFRRGSQTDS